MPDLHLDKPLTRRPAGYSSWEDFRANSPAVQRQLVELATRLPDLQHAEYWQPPDKASAQISELGELLATLRKPGEYRTLHIAIGWCLIIVGGSRPRARNG